MPLYLRKSLVPFDHSLDATPISILNAREKVADDIDEMSKMLSEIYKADPKHQLTPEEKAGFLQLHKRMAQNHSWAFHFHKHFITTSWVKLE